MTQPRIAVGRAFRPPIVPLEAPRAETPAVSFGDLVRMLAESIADAQTALDRASAELVAELAATTVDIVPSVTETIAADGSVTYEHGKPRKVSLLDLGVTPTFYQFSEARVEVAMDLHVVESETSSEQGKRFALFAGTSSITRERKLNRDLRVTSRFSATLVPVPHPLRLEPVRTTVNQGEGQ
ncbi:MAG: hypothetical protein ACKVVT_00720 [Dehalococcoidia bacterium]